MIKQKLINYIKSSEAQGYSPKQLYNYLVQQGYNPNDVSEAMNYVNKKGVSKSRGDVKMNMLERFKAIFASPSRLFSEIKEERDYKPTLMYYFVFVLGLNIVSFVINLIAGTAVMIQNTIVSLVTSIIAVLVFAFFISLAASWFGGNRSWIQGLKAAVYPGTIFTVFGLIIAIIGMIFKTTTTLDLSSPQSIISNIRIMEGMGILIGGILMGLGALALLIWTIVLWVKGIAISHDISGGKAFGTLIIAVIFNAIVIGILNWILTKIGLIKAIAPTI